MKEAFRILQRRVGFLSAPTTRHACGEFACVRCGAPMVAPSLVVADAGQAYEALETSAIDSSIDNLFERARAVTTHCTLTVLHHVCGNPL